MQWRWWWRWWREGEGGFEALELGELVKVDREALAVAGPAACAGQPRNTKQKGAASRNTREQEERMMCGGGDGTGRTGACQVARPWRAAP